MDVQGFPDARRMDLVRLTSIRTAVRQHLDKAVVRICKAAARKSVHEIRRKCGDAGVNLVAVRIGDFQ